MNRVTFRKHLSSTPSAIALLFCLVVILSSPLLAAATTKLSSANLTWEVPRLSESPTIDGRLDEWGHLPAMYLGINPTQVKHHLFWGGPLDCSARAWLGWDAEFLYFATEITDNVFQQDQYDPFYIWANDSVQIALDPRLDRSAGAYAEDDRLFGWASCWKMAPNDIVTFCWHGPRALGEVPTIKAAIRKKTNRLGWTCEAAIPWGEVGVEPIANMQMGFSWLVNDADVAERDGWIEWTGGIGSERNPKRFGTITLVGSSHHMPAPLDSKRESQRLIETYHSMEHLTPPGRLLWIGHANALADDMGLAERNYRRVLAEYPKDESARAALLSLTTAMRATPREKTEVYPLLRELLDKHGDSFPMGQAAGWKASEWELGAGGRGATVLRELLEEFIAISQGDEAGAGVIRGLADSLPRIEENPAQAVLDEILPRIAAEYPAAYLALYMRNHDLLKRVTRLYKEGSYLFAAQVLEPALAQEAWQKPDRIKALHTMGLCYQATDQTSKAVYWFEEALRADSAIARELGSLYQIAVCYYRQRAFEKAREYFQKALADNPKGPLADYAQERIRQCEEMIALLAAQENAGRELTHREEER